MWHISQNTCLIKNQQCDYAHHKGNNKSNIKQLIRCFFLLEMKSRHSMCIHKILHWRYFTSVGISKNINWNVWEKQVSLNITFGNEEYSTQMNTASLLPQLLTIWQKNVPFPGKQSVLLAHLHFSLLQEELPKVARCVPHCQAGPSHLTATCSAGRGSPSPILIAWRVSHLLLPLEDAFSAIVIIHVFSGCPVIGWQRLPVQPGSPSQPESLHPHPLLGTAIFLQLPFWGAHLRQLSCHWGCHFSTMSYPRWS